MPFNVAIIGAGPAGLVTALCLARRGGFDITVFEKEGDHMTVPRFNPERSYTIDITGHGHKALQYCEATARFDKDLIKFKGVHLRCHPTGAQTDEYPEPGWTGSRGDICRALQAEINEKHPSEIVWKFETEVKVEDCFDGTLSWDNGEKDHHYDLVVGCDGAGAVTRQAMEEVDGFIVESYQMENYCSMVHFDKPAADKLDSSYLEIFNFNPLMVGGAINGEGGKSTPKWFCMVGFKEPNLKFEDVAQAKAYITSHCGTSIWDFVSDEEMEAFIKRPINNIGRAKVCSSFHMGKVVMVGDSGNPFPPIGQGINHAMEAAMVLDQCIGNAVNDHQRLEFAAAAYSYVWKPEADGINWIARRVDFDNAWKMFLVKVALAGGCSALQEAKHGDKSYKEVADAAKARQTTFGLDPDSDVTPCSNCSVS